MDIIDGIDAIAGFGRELAQKFRAIEIFIEGQPRIKVPFTNSSFVILVLFPQDQIVSWTNISKLSLLYNPILSLLSE